MVESGKTAPRRGRKRLCRVPALATAAPAALALALALVGTAAQAESGPIVNTASGKVQGFFNSSQVAEFLGIPYAAPPVGKLRWMPPATAASWNGIRQATNYANTCAQITTLGVFAGPANNNEDCLYANVFSPNLDKQAKLPVILWIHGGGNVDGESNDYDGSKMASQGKTVVVTFNYRLNLMGFLSVPSLDSEGHDFSNYGLMDQHAAMQWVKKNIAKFGGDPNNVTVGGQSAGAEDTGLAMLSPEDAGLLQRGICESFCPTSNLLTLQAAETLGSEFATAAGCGNKTGAAQAMCLRKVPASMVEQLAGTASANGPYITGPILDGTIIPVQPPTAWANGQFTHIPLMNGNVQDEQNFTLAITEYFEHPRAPLTAAQYQNYVTTTYSTSAYPPGTAEQVLKLYPVADYPSAQLAWDRAGTDPRICAEMALNRQLSTQIPVYAYLFEDQSPPFYFPNMPGFTSDAYHTSDIQFLFPLYHGGQGTAHPLKGVQEALSNQLVTAWTNFAWTGNPDGAGNAPWPAYKPAMAASDILVENVPSLSTESTSAFYTGHHCGFWLQYIPY